jgi:hypothetical protein
MTNDAGAATPNGPGAAAILATAIGCFLLGVLALAGDALPAAARLLNLWNPTGPLSGVTFAAIAAWLIAWAVLSRLWAGRTIEMKRVGGASALMILAGLLLTFPPFMDLLQGK